MQIALKKNKIIYSSDIPKSFVVKAIMTLPKQAIWKAMNVNC